MITRNTEIVDIIDKREVPFEERIGEIEKILLMEALERNRWIKLKATRELKMTYRVFNYKCEKYGLDVISPRKRRKRGSSPSQQPLLV